MPGSSQLPQIHVVGFSGHRRLQDRRAAAQAIRDALAGLRRDGSGEWIALSSIAIGSDSVFAQESLAADMAWHAILPLPPAEFRKDFSDGEWRDVETMLGEAEQVRVIADSGPREEAYLDGGIETVNGCDVLMAVWDGEPARGRGGTAEVIAYARELKKPIVLIDAGTFVARRENFDRFIPRDQHLHFFNSLPKSSAEAQPNVFQALAPIFDFQQKVDQAASRGAPHFRRMIAATVILYVMATLVAAAILAFGWHHVALLWATVLCLFSALIVALMLRHTSAHHNWVRCRLAAEVARSALATWSLPRAASLFVDVDVPEYRPLMRSLHILHRRAAAAQPMPLPEFKKLYSEQRIDHQHAYYRKRLHKTLPLLVSLRASFWVATSLALACTAGYAVGETLHWTWTAGGLQRLMFSFLPISLPVSAAALISLISIHDLHRRVARYREMEHVLATARSQIAYCQTWNSAERIVRHTENALLQEVLEWHAITSFAESH